MEKEGKVSQKSIEIEKKNADLESRLKETEEKLRDLETRLEQQHQQSEELAATLRSSYDQNNALKQSLSESQAFAEQYQRTIQSLEKKLEEAKFSSPSTEGEQPVQIINPKDSIVNYSVGTE